MFVQRKKPECSTFTININWKINNSNTYTHIHTLPLKKDYFNQERNKEEHEKIKHILNSSWYFQSAFWVSMSITLFPLWMLPFFWVAKFCSQFPLVNAIMVSGPISLPKHMKWSWSKGTQKTTFCTVLTANTEMVQVEMALKAESYCRKRFFQGV